MVQATCKRNSMGQSCMQQGGPGVWNAMISRFQKQLNVIRVRSFCNQLAVCTTHYGTVLVSLLIREFSFKFGQRRSIQGQPHYDWGWNAVVLSECIHQPFYIHKYPAEDYHDDLSSRSSLIQRLWVELTTTWLHLIRSANGLPLMRHQSWWSVSVSNIQKEHRNIVQLCTSLDYAVFVLVMIVMMMRGDSYTDI